MQRLASAFSLMLLLAAPVAQGMDFRPVFDGSLQQFHLLPDDRILITGRFNRVNGRHCPDLCRLNPDGSTDSGFGPVILSPNLVSSIDSGPPSMVVQPDGKILLFGRFNNPWALDYTHQGHLLRIRDTGLVDDTFRITELGHAPFRNAEIRVVTMLDDGRLLVGGSYTSINGVARRNLALLLPNGEVDPGFNANLSLPADPDNRDSVVLISTDDDGNFLVVTDGPFQRTRAVQRLNSDGSLDLTFGTLPLHADSNIRSLIALPGQQFLVGGLFAFGPGDLQGIVRLDATGLVDPSFQADTPDRVEVMERMADGRVLVGGELAEFNGSTVRRLVRILSNGLTDLTFVSPIEQGILVNPFSAFTQFAVRNLAVDSAGNILVGGTFHGADNQIQARLLKLDASGALLRDPDPEANDTVFTFALQPDGHVLIGGRFTEMGGQARARLARLKPDGSLDPDFTTGTSSTVRAIGVQRDGKLVIAGAFGTLAGQPRSRIGRLNPDGSLDPDFNPDVSNAVRCVAIQADGAILIGGVLTAVGGIARSRLARLHPDGSLDASFDPAPNGEVRSITLDRLGRILVAGSFTTIGGVAQARLARLNPDGSVDTDFTPDIDAEVRVVATEANRHIQIGGLFSTVNAEPRSGFAVLQEGGSLASDFDYDTINFDGPVHASVNRSGINDLQVHTGGFHVGEFTTVQGQPRAGFVTLGTFSAVQELRYNADDNLYAVLVTEDGRLLLGGDFSTINFSSRSHLATVHSRNFSRSRVAPFPSSDPFIYFLARSGPHLEHPMHFEFSLDGIEFTPFDSTVNFTPPAQNYYMRISGRSRAGFANSSSGLIEITDFLPGRGITIFRDAFQ